MPRLQFSLRSLMLTVLISGIAIAVPVLLRDPTLILIVLVLGFYASLPLGGLVFLLIDHFRGKNWRLMNSDGQGEQAKRQVK